jgi:hypothetical protein
VPGPAFDAWLTEDPVIPSEILSAFEDEIHRGMSSSLETARDAAREFRWTRDSRRMERAERSPAITIARAATPRAALVVHRLAPGVELEGATVLELPTEASTGSLHLRLDGGGRQTQLAGEIRLGFPVLVDATSRAVLRARSRHRPRHRRARRHGPCLAMCTGSKGGRAARQPPPA